MKFDLHNKIGTRRAISPVVVADNTATVSEVLDTKGSHSAALVLALGSIATAAAVFALTIEHGNEADLSDAVPVPARDLNGAVGENTAISLASFTGGDADETRKIGYIGSKRYVRATITPSNNVGDASFSGLWLTAVLSDGPVENPGE